MKRFKQFLKESTLKKINVVVITKSNILKLNNTVKHIKKACDKRGINFYPIFTNTAYIADQDYDKGNILIHNIDGNGTKIKLDIKNTACFVRGGALNDQAGIGIVTILQSRGCFMINDIKTMQECSNKYTMALKFEMNNIPSPKTSFVSNKDSIDTSIKKIGGQFPVVVKTIKGAKGVGVSKIDSEDSLRSVLQSLWKFNAEVIIQEFKPIDFDVRTLVLNGKIMASTKRVKNKASGFRTNVAQGADSVPYRLSDEEKKLIIKTAKVSGGYYIGIDHIVVGKDLFILEVNGSPGSGVKYMEYYSKIYGGGTVNGPKLIDHVIEKITDKKNWVYPYTEIGKVEFISVPELSMKPVKCKLDTGNGTFNSIDAEDIKINGKNVTFKTINGKVLTKPIVNKKRIKMKNQKEFDEDEKYEDRQVVLFDIIFGGKKYIKVPFNLADRSGMLYPILIGQDFLRTIKRSVNVSKRFTLPENKNL